MEQWLTCLFRNRWLLVSREFEPLQNLSWFPWARNFTLIVQSWLVRWTVSSV